MSKYQAVVFDIDGTAVPNRADGAPSPALISAVRRARAEGMHLLAATGRPATLALPVLQALELTDCCVISGGSVIIDPSTGHTVREARLTRNQVEAAFVVCRRYHYQLWVDDTKLEDAHLPASTSANILMIVSIDSADLTPMIQGLSEIPGVFATSTQAWGGGHVVHVTTVDGTKEHGIQFALEQIGVASEHAIGVGDGDNDVHLFAAVGHRVAMGNASDQLKSVADEIAPSVEDDGLAWVINKYAA